MSKHYAVDLFFDMLSPYAYIMFESLLGKREKWPMTVNLRPFVVFQVFNRKHALSRTGKEYMSIDVSRLARYHNIPIKFPEDFFATVFSKSSLAANRLICAVQIAHPEKAETVARALFRRFWEGSGVFENNDFLEVLSACGVRDENAMMSSISSDTVKAKMKKNSEDAIENGCFGTPWIVITLEGGKKDFGLHIMGHLMGHQFEGPLTSSL